MPTLVRKLTITLTVPSPNTRQTERTGTFQISGVFEAGVGGTPVAYNASYTATDNIQTALNNLFVILGDPSREEAPLFIRQGLGSMATFSSVLTDNNTLVVTVKYNLPPNNTLPNDGIFSMTYDAAGLAVTSSPKTVSPCLANGGALFATTITRSFNPDWNQFVNATPFPITYSYQYSNLFDIQEYQNSFSSSVVVDSFDTLAMAWDRVRESIEGEGGIPIVTKKVGNDYYTVAAAQLSPRNLIPNNIAIVQIGLYDTNGFPENWTNVPFRNMAYMMVAS